MILTPVANPGDKSNVTRALQNLVALGALEFWQGAVLHRLVVKRVCCVHAGEGYSVLD